MSEKQILLDLDARDDLNEAGRARLMELTQGSMDPVDISWRAYNSTERLSSVEHKLYMQLQSASEDQSLNEDGERLLSRLRQRDYSPTEAFTIAAGKGAMDVVHGAGDITNRIMARAGLPVDAEGYREDRAREQAIYDPLRQRQPVSTFLGEAAGEAGPFMGVPMGGAVTLPGKIGRGATAGAIEGGILYEPTLEQRGANMVAGGVGGGILTGIVEGIARRLGGRDIPVANVPAATGAGGMAQDFRVSPDVVEPGPVPPEAGQYTYWDEQFGLPYTRGQFTGDMAQQQREQRIRAGAFGPDAQQQADTFMDFQQQRLNETVADEFARAAMRRGSQQMQPVDVPLVPGTYRTENQAAQRFQQILQDRADRLWSDIDRAYEVSKAANLQVSPDAANLLLNRLDTVLDQADISTPAVNPMTHEMLNRVREFWPDLPPGQTIEAVDLEGLYALRREITNAATQAKGSDAYNLRTLRRTIDETFAEFVENPQYIVRGDLRAIKNLRRGIRLRADYGRLYGPQHARFRSGRLRRDPGGLAIEDIIETDIQGQEVVNTLFGRNTRLGTNTRTLPVLRRVEQIAGRNSEEFQLLRNVALEKFRRSIRKVGPDQTEGPNISPQKFDSAWRTLRDSEPELLEMLFDPQTIARLDDLHRAARRMNYRAFNNSQSAHFIEGILRESQGPITPGGAVAGVGAYAAGMDPATATVVGFALPQAGNAIRRMLSDMFGQRSFTRETRAVPFAAATGMGLGVETGKEIRDE